MDTKRIIDKIIVEALDTKNFDDIYIECIQCEEFDKRSFHIQVKNYNDTKLENIIIGTNNLTIKGNKNEFNPSDNNILVVNTLSIETDESFLGLPCKK